MRSPHFAPAQTVFALEMVSNSITVTEEHYSATQSPVVAHCSSFCYTVAQVPIDFGVSIEGIMMKIPVFVSCPTTLNKKQEAARAVVQSMLDSLNLEPRALGRSDYPADLPLREVFVIARHCAGGIILGFNQFTATTGILRPGTKKEETISKSINIPTPWNNLEAGILFSLGLPLLVFREEGVSGGVFDPGVTDVFVHNMPDPKANHDDIKEIFLKWRGKVDGVYYSDAPRLQKY